LLQVCTPYSITVASVSRSQTRKPFRPSPVSRQQCIKPIQILILNIQLSRCTLAQYLSGRGSFQGRYLDVAPAILVKPNKTSIVVVPRLACSAEIGSVTSLPYIFPIWNRLSSLPQFSSVKVNSEFPLLPHRNAHHANRLAGTCVSFSSNFPVLRNEPRAHAGLRTSILP
jgi:hypothetical protein